ncbi:hypothetical protein [Streptomyces sp. LN245]
MIAADPGPPQRAGSMVGESLDGHITGMSATAHGQGYLAQRGCDGG